MDLLSKDGKMPKSGLKYPIKNYFHVQSISTRKPEDDLAYTNNVFTASIDYNKTSNLAMKCTASGLISNGFVRYYQKMACYKDEASVKHAVIVRTLVKVAAKNDPHGSDPAWTIKLLPDGVSRRNHVVLYENGNADHTNERLFGFLQFRMDKRVLSIPRDYNDLTVPWEDFLFDEYPHQGYNER